MYDPERYIRRGIPHQILEYLDDVGSTDETIAELAQRLRCCPTSLKTHLVRLEIEGLIERKKHGGRPRGKIDWRIRRVR